MDRFEVMAAFEPCPAASPFSTLPCVALEKQQCECSAAALSFNSQKEETDLVFGCGGGR